MESKLKSAPTETKKSKGETKHVREFNIWQSTTMSVDHIRLIPQTYYSLLRAHYLKVEFIEPVIFESAIAKQHHVSAEFSWAILIALYLQSLSFKKKDEKSGRLL